MPRPLASAEMALIRLAYASDLPTPEGGASQARPGGRRAAPARRRFRPAGAGDRAPRSARPNSTPLQDNTRLLAPASARPRPPRRPQRAYARRGAAGCAVIRRPPRSGGCWLGAGQARYPALPTGRSSARCGSPGSNPASIAFTPHAEGAAGLGGLAQTLSRRLQEWTGERWMVALVAKGLNH